MARSGIGVRWVGGVMEVACGWLCYYGVLRRGRGSEGFEPHAQSAWCLVPYMGGVPALQYAPVSPHLNCYTWQV